MPKVLLNILLMVSFIYKGMSYTVTMLIKSGLTASKSEARRAVQQGGVSVDGEKVTDVFQTFAGEALSGEGVVLKKGKKNFRKVLVK